MYYFDYFSKMHITFFMTKDEKLASLEMRKKRNEEQKQLQELRAESRAAWRRIKSHWGWRQFALDHWYERHNGQRSLADMNPYYRPQ